MRLCETLPLGDRRYLALVSVEGRRYLLGSAGSSISLLASLPPPGSAVEPLAGVGASAGFDPEEYKTWQ